MSSNIVAQDVQRHEVAAAHHVQFADPTVSRNCSPGVVGLNSDDHGALKISPATSSSLQCQDGIHNKQQMSIVMSAISASSSGAQLPPLLSSAPLPSQNHRDLRNHHFFSSFLPTHSTHSLVGNAGHQSHNIEWGPLSPVFIQNLWRHMRRCRELILPLRAEAILRSPLHSASDCEWNKVFDALGKCIIELSALQTVVADGVRKYSDETMLRFWVFALADIKLELATLAAILQAAERSFAPNHSHGRNSSIMYLNHLNLSVNDMNTQKAAVHAEVLLGFRHYWRMMLSGVR